MATMSSVTKLKKNGYKKEICQVYELATKHKFKVLFDELKVEGPCYMRTFRYQIKVVKFTAEGLGPSK